MRRMIIPFTLAMLLVSAIFVLGQENPGIEPGLKITVSNKTCGLVLGDNAAATPEVTAQPESTAEPLPNYPVLTLGSDCFEVTPHLNVASNDTLWIALALPNEPTWQTFKAMDGDPHPPKFDKRGRFVGCSIPLQGEQTCRVLWENIDITYLIEIPISVGKAYVAPPPTRVTISTPVPPVSTPNNSGVWGECGSCTTCGGPVEHCVLAPDNTCVWDAARCENPNPAHH